MTTRRLGGKVVDRSAVETLVLVVVRSFVSFAERTTTISTSFGRNLLLSLLECADGLCQ